MKKGNDQKQNAEKRKNRMTALLMALILCVGMVSGTNKEVRAQSASQNSETQTASESDVFSCFFFFFQSLKINHLRVYLINK